MLSFLAVVFGCLVLVISIFILAFGDTKHYQKLRKECNICCLRAETGQDRCLDFISTKLTDKCRMLPQEVAMLNEHLRHSQNLTYVIGEMHKCCMPGMQALKCQLMLNAKEISTYLPNDPGSESPCSSPGKSSKLDSPVQNTNNYACPINLADTASPSKGSCFSSLAIPNSYGLPAPRLPSPSTCSLSQEGSQIDQCMGPKRYAHCDECFQQSAIDQAIKFLSDSLKEECG